MVQEKKCYEEERTAAGDDLPVRDKIEHFLPPIDVALKIYLVDAVNVRDNTFESCFTVMLDWEDPSL